MSWDCTVEVLTHLSPVPAGRPAARCAASSDDESTGSQGSPSGSQGGSEMDFDAYLTLFAEKVRNGLLLLKEIPAQCHNQKSTCLASSSVAFPRASADYLRLVLCAIPLQYEASENKGAVAGYSIGALVAFIFIEYFIHLPVFNVLLGFPLQLLGVLMAPYLGVRYLMDGKDIKDDVGTAIVRRPQCHAMCLGTASLR